MAEARKQRDDAHKELRKLREERARHDRAEAEKAKNAQLKAEEAAENDMRESDRKVLTNFKYVRRLVNKIADDKAYRIDDRGLALPPDLRPNMDEFYRAWRAATLDDRPAIFKAQIFTLLNAFTLGCRSFGVVGWAQGEPNPSGANDSLDTILPHLRKFEVLILDRQGELF